jgi:hypothetical protein
MPRITDPLELYATSEERVDQARRAFDDAKITLANARTFGTSDHVRLAIGRLEDTAAAYAASMGTHAKLAIDAAKALAR